MGRQLSTTAPTAFKNWTLSLNLRRSTASLCFSLSPITGTHDLFSIIKLPEFLSTLATTPQERTRYLHEMPWATIMVNKAFAFREHLLIFPFRWNGCLCPGIFRWEKPRWLLCRRDDPRQVQELYHTNCFTICWKSCDICMVRSQGVARRNSVWLTFHKGNCQWSKVHALLQPHLHIVEASKLDATLRCQPPLPATLRQLPSSILQLRNILTKLIPITLWLLGMFQRLSAIPCPLFS